MNKCLRKIMTYYNNVPSPYPYNHHIVILCSSSLKLPTNFKNQIEKQGVQLIDEVKTVGVLNYPKLIFIPRKKNYFK